MGAGGDDQTMLLTWIPSPGSEPGVVGVTEPKRPAAAAADEQGLAPSPGGTTLAMIETGTQRAGSEPCPTVPIGYLVLRASQFARCTKDGA